MKSTFSFATFLLMICIQVLSAQVPQAEPAPEWSALFDRSSGWTGADGIYSIPLSGKEAPGTAGSTKTLFVFGDTFIGSVGADNKRLPGTKMVNNTLGLLKGGDPIPSKMSFIVRKDSSGNVAAYFVPTTPNSEQGHWYWLSDGISINGKVHILALRMKKGDGGVFDFAVSGTALISFPVGTTNPYRDHTQIEVPLHYVPTDGRGEMIFGAGILPNTSEAGAPFPDGYIYIYGTQNDPFDKKLLAARVLPASFTDFSKWRFWNGFDWVTEISNAAPLANRVSSELSVSPLADGRYVLVFQLDTLSRDVAIRVANSPVGTFGQHYSIYKCPETAIDNDVFCYNAKAHPHLSKPGELLISYNVNSFEFADHFNNADIYRPRFIRIRTQ
jgi:Domain of unknown function (DUF4185)